MNNHDDSTDIINSVIRDIAAWDIKRDGYDPIDEGMIDDWIYEYSLIATKENFMKICKEYWDEYLEPSPTYH
jgi:hypothetical protein|tara:strand:+ start:197 stop:412 length:216 start_codon:yes stop_codon:yes gene_type:complete